MTGRIEKFRWLAAMAACTLLAGCDGATSGGPGVEAVLGVQVVQAEQRDVKLYIDMVGTTLGTQDVPIRARVEGFLESMEFRKARSSTRATCSTPSTRNPSRPRWWKHKAGWPRPKPI